MFTISRKEYEKLQAEGKRIFVLESCVEIMDCLGRGTELSESPAALPDQLLERQTTVQILKIRESSRPCYSGMQLLSAECNKHDPAPTWRREYFIRC